MARHNREATGEDQFGRKYEVSFQPDWLYQVKVTRDLAHGRQSTKTLYRNEAPAVVEPGSRIRTRIRSEELGLDVEVDLNDARGVVRRITVETVAPEGVDQGEPLSFTISRRELAEKSGAA